MEMASWGWVFVGMPTVLVGIVIVIYEMGRVRGAKDLARWVKEKHDNAS